MTTTTLASHAARKPHQGFLAHFLLTPQQTLLRRAMFQIHLWAGLLLALYVALIGLSGSITVFRMDLAMCVPHALQAQKLDPSRVMTLDVVQRNLHSAIPGARVLSTLAPDEQHHVFASMLATRNARLFATSDPFTGQVLRVVDMKTNWAFLIGEFHESLLAGEMGKQINGIAAVLLLLVLLSGLLLWWRGIKNWTRGLKVSFKSNWKRINYDLHCAVGLWTLLFCLMWSITTIVMVWPDWSSRTISIVSPLTDAVKEPEVMAPIHAGKPCSIHPQQMVNAAVAADSGTRFAVYSLMPKPGQPARIYLARGAIRNRGTWDLVYVDPCSGNVLKVWHRWQFKSTADVLIAGSRMIHVGFIWGFWAQVLWALAGLAFPLLALTSVLMYWNRYLSKQWKKIKISC